MAAYLVNIFSLWPGREIKTAPSAVVLPAWLPRSLYSSMPRSITQPLTTSCRVKHHQHQLCYHRE